MPGDAAVPDGVELEADRAAVPPEPEPTVAPSSAWEEVRLGEDGEALLRGGNAVLPEGVEFVWYASRARNQHGAWSSWRMECAPAHSLGVLFKSFRLLYMDREHQFLWRPIERVPEPPSDAHVQGLDRYGRT